MGTLPGFGTEAPHRYPRVVCRRDEAAFGGTTMSGAIASWYEVADAFDQRYAGIMEDQWAAATPCDQWTVRDLVDHVTTVQLLMSQLVGATTEPGADWPAVRDGMAVVLAKPDALEGTSNIRGWARVRRCSG